MKKIVLLLMLWPMCALSQGIRFTTQVQDTFGNAVRSPAVRFCSEPATGLVCTPLAAGIFSDRALTQPLSNPTNGDVNGNVAFYAAPGRYHAQISGTGIVSFDVPDIILNGATSDNASNAPANQFANGITALGALIYAQPSASNLSDGTTGTGLVVRSGAPTIGNATVGLADGLISSPSLSWSNDTTGWYRAGSGDIRLTSGSVDLFRFLSSQLIVNGVSALAFGSSGVLTPDTGLSRCAAGTLCAGNSAATDASGTFEARKIKLDGSSSGSVTIIVPAAAGANTWTQPAVTDTAVGKATTDVLTNKTLDTAGAGNVLKINGTQITDKSGTGNVCLTTNCGLTTPTISGPTLTGDTLVKRVKANQGTALVIGDVGSLSGWGNTATVSAVSGTDMSGSITISSSGTGQTANPTFTLTFHDGTWTTAPILVASRADSAGPLSAQIAVSASATNASFAFINGTPVAGISYVFNFIVIGK